MSDPGQPDRREIRLAGKIIAPGIGCGHVHFEEPILSTSQPSTIQPDQREVELEALQRAIDLVKSSIQEHIREAYAPANEELHQILYAHRVILEDKRFLEGIRDRINNQLYTAERAVREAFTAAADRLASTADLALQARAHDLREVCQRLRTVLLHGAPPSPPVYTDGKPLVFLSGTLHTASVMRARQFKAAGFVTSCETISSQAAILLRASGIPAVGGVELPHASIEEGGPLIVDAIQGEVILWPDPDTISTTQHRAAELRARDEAPVMPPLEVLAADGRRITLWANIDHPSQISMVSKKGLTGVGLFRTEFLYLDHGRIPDEEQQVQVYRGVIERLGGRPIVIRTFDFGADHIPPGLDQPPGANPALGMRGIRRHLRSQTEELRIQLRAILRASTSSDVSVLLPMVTHTSDVWAVRQILDSVIDELDQEGVPFNRDVKLGAMIEVPSAAFCTADLFQVVDFVTIGTNDLIQYLTASDRSNEAVIDYQTPEVAGLRQLLEYVMTQARALGKAEEVYVCGDMASDPQGARALVELGISTLSINPAAAEKIKQAFERS